MRVSEIMSQEIVTVTPDKRVGQALQLMQKHQIRHLPVVEGDRMVGWLTSRDLREVLLASMLEKITVADVMVRAPISVSPDTGVEEAARLVKEHKIGGMPVLDGDRLVGVVTMLDVIGAFLTLLSLIRTSSRLDLLLEDQPEAMRGGRQNHRPGRRQDYQRGLRAPQGQETGLLFSPGKMRPRPHRGGAGEGGDQGAGRDSVRKFRNLTGL